jgi:hypothetical protein
MHQEGTKKNSNVDGLMDGNNYVRMLRKPSASPINHVPQCGTL